MNVHVRKNQDRAAETTEEQSLFGSDPVLPADLRAAGFRTTDPFSGEQQLSHHFHEELDAEEGPESRNDATTNE